MSITNRIASWVLDRLIELVPEPLKSENEKLEDPPPVWRYTIRGPQGDAYLTRVLFPRIPWLEWRPMIHKFHRPDVEDALHNHPWKWCASLILAGGYVEERMLPDESQLLGRPALRDLEPLDIPIFGWKPADAEEMFLRRFEYLTGDKVERL